MLFGRGQRPSRHAIAIVRDVVEIVAILAAGIWAFYVFAYENRIKPAAAEPEVNVTASMQRLSQRNGLLAVGLHLELHNIGTVRAHFLGMAINVYGRRIVVGPRAPARPQGTRYDFEGFYRMTPEVPVYSYAYITQLGDPSTGEDSLLDPGSTIENDRTFYVPERQFDLLTLAIDAPFTKFDKTTLPSRLTVSRLGAVRVAHVRSPDIEQYNIDPVTSLDVR